MAVDAELFNIRINSKHAQASGTELHGGQKPSPGSTEKVRVTKNASVGVSSSPQGSPGDPGAANCLDRRFRSKNASKQVREKTRLLEEVRENKERAIEHAQAQVEAQ